MFKERRRRGLFFSLFSCFFVPISRLIVHAFMQLDMPFLGFFLPISAVHPVHSPAWGEEHQIEFGHALAAQRPFDTVFNIGPFVVGGDADTVCQVSIDRLNSSNNIAPSFRQVIDTSNWDASLAMHAPGQSGHLASDHYGDLSGPWLGGQYYQLNWSQDAVDTSAKKLLQLLPWLK